MRRLIAVALVLVFALAPAADALSIGARAILARPSTEYSPHTAWDHGYYGCGVTIAVFDEGVDDAHPLLDGKVVAGVDFTTTEPVQAMLFPGNPQPIVGSHGTPVAGLATSHGGQFFTKPEDAPQYADDDLVGVAPCAWMVDVMFNDMGLPTDDLVANMVAAFDWAVANKDNDWGDAEASNDGIDIITMSWSPLDGTDGSDELSQAANRAVEAGIVVLGSMGNSGPDYQPWGTPAAADLTLGIAALFDERTVTRDDDHLIDYSTIGPRPDDKDDNPYDEMKPDVASPAHNVVGPGASYLDGREYALVCFGYQEDVPVVGDPSGCETQFGGTSAATPMTAGVVALILSANGNLTPADVKEILHQSADQHPDAEPEFPELNAVYDKRYGWGMTNAYKATQLARVWPGLALGKDTDSDGIRDIVDVAPHNPNIRALAVPASTPAPAAAPDGADSDGDNVIDSSDGAPLDPSMTQGAPQKPEQESPGLSLAVILAVVGVAVLARRR